MARYDSLDVPIPDRAAAGRALAQLLVAYRQRRDCIVLALPRGGVPVAYEIAQALELRLDLLLVRKLGVPGHSELAMGAIASGGGRVLNPDVLQMLHIDDATIEAVVARETQELQRRDQAYRGERPLPQLRDQQVILVDDGVATGATMRAAVQAVRGQRPARLVVAVPVAAADSVARLRTEVDEVVCPFIPEWLMAIGPWYLDFSQTSDQEVLDLLARAWQRDCEQTP
ncbi:phosphoribosyltransferase [Pseudomonas sp.]|uniref:phosphoribosyltransferase n=1 Tax=Pseudomonas sp. TaxID=306 RepID=UPI0027339008|nr:phosphoribosyltransferase family protein [Pseudomonas sp.]MDP3813785.1 phosphoribosyltransferase family protein [Pseudomonas sp.]